MDWADWLSRRDELKKHSPNLGVRVPSDVSIEDLVSKGAVRNGQLVKVLGSGEITVAVNVTADAFSASAKQKIEAAGGSATTA